MIKRIAEGIMIDREALNELSKLVEINHRDIAIICTSLILSLEDVEDSSKKTPEFLEVGEEYTFARTGVVDYLTNAPIPLLVKGEDKYGEAVVKNVGRSITGGTYVRFEVKSLDGDSR